LTPSGRLAALGATLAFHHGLLRYLPVDAPERAGQIVIIEVTAEEGARRLGSSPLRDRLRGLMNEGYRYLLLNVAELTYVDSIMLGAIIEGYTSALKRGGGLKLLHASQRLRQLLKVAKLDKVIVAYESEEVAVASFPSSDARNRRQEEQQP